MRSHLANRVISRPMLIDKLHKTPGRVAFEASHPLIGIFAAYLAIAANIRSSFVGLGNGLHGTLFLRIPMASSKQSGGQNPHTPMRLPRPHEGQWQRKRHGGYHPHHLSSNSWKRCCRVCHGSLPYQQPNAGGATLERHAFGGLWQTTPAIKGQWQRKQHGGCQPHHLSSNS